LPQRARGKSKIPGEISHEVSSSVERGGLVKGRLAYTWAFKKTNIAGNYFKGFEGQTLKGRS
jgi:hypothetical protein